MRIMSSDAWEADSLPGLWKIGVSNKLSLIRYLHVIMGIFVAKLF